MKFGAWGFTWVWSFCPSTVWHKKPTGHNFLSLLYRLVQPNSLARASICPVMSTVNVRKIFKEYPGSGSIGTASNRFWADFFCLAACPAAKAPCTTPALHQWSNGWLNLITWYIIYTYHIRYARSSCSSCGFILCLWNFMLGAKPGVDWAAMMIRPITFSSDTPITTRSALVKQNASFYTFLQHIALVLKTTLYYSAVWLRIYPS